MNIKSLITPILCGIVIAASTLSANAHAVWATIKDGNVTFALRHNVWGESYERYTAYVSDIKPTAGKKSIELGVPVIGARSGKLPQGSTVVKAEAKRGVDKGQENFVAVFYAKAAISERAASMRVGSDFEVIPEIKGGKVHVNVYRTGKLMSGVKVSVYWPGREEPYIAESDGNGHAVIELPTGFQTAGVVGVHAVTYIDEPVMYEGKQYPKTAIQTTVSFPINLANRR